MICYILMPLELQGSMKVELGYSVIKWVVDLKIGH